MRSKVRVVFFGEKPLAYQCLKDLFERECDIVAVATRGKTQGLWWGEQKVRHFAQEHEIPLIRREEIRGLHPDLLISVLYPYVIEDELLGVRNRLELRKWRV